MALTMVKRSIRKALGAFGYSLRDLGSGVGGVELLHDASILLNDVNQPVLFDVGANVGQTTRAMLDSFVEPRIHAFEPSPSTFELLKSAVGHLPGVTATKMAFGDAAGVLPFHVTRDHSVNDSLLEPTWNAGGTVVDVDVTTVDDFCAAQNIQSVALLKIDTQGFDLNVLRGARRMLGDRRIRLYSCEANCTPMYQHQATVRDLLEFADEVGYRLVGFYEQTYVENQLTYFDMLFAAKLIGR